MGLPHERKLVRLINPATGDRSETLSPVKIIVLRLISPAIGDRSEMGLTQKYKVFKLTLVLQSADKIRDVIIGKP